MHRIRLSGLLTIPVLAGSLVLGAMPAVGAVATDAAPTGAGLTLNAPPPADYGFVWRSPTKGKGHGVNKPRAGTSVPVTFTLDSTVKTGALLATGWPKVRRVDCSTHKPVAGTEWMSRPFGPKGLSHDGDAWTYSWHVRPEWGNGPLACRELRIKLTDGTTHSAFYRFQPPPRNHAPVAGDDFANIYVGHTSSLITGNVLVNDSDPDGDRLLVTDAGSFDLANGTLVIATDGDYSYTLSDHGGPLTDRFTYHVSDGHGGSDDAVLQVTTTFGDPV